jgi:hypothetical protein
MSGSGQNRKSQTTIPMSVKPPKAEVAHGNIHKMQRSVSEGTAFAAETFRHQRPFRNPGTIPAKRANGAV